jgi:hypothetical protein
MARARALSSYPPAFWDIMERTGVRRQTVSSEVADHRAAMRLQGKFYAYRQAIKRELMLTKVHPDQYTAEKIQQLNDLWDWSQVTVCWFNRSSPPEQPTTVSFMHRDNTPEAQMLNEMLRQNPETVPEIKPAEQASLDRLLEKLDPAVVKPLDKKYY